MGMVWALVMGQGSHQLVDTLSVEFRGRGSGPELFGCRAAKGTGDTWCGDAKVSVFSVFLKWNLWMKWTPCELYLLDSISRETGASE